MRGFSPLLLIVCAAFGQRPQGVEVRGEYRNLAGYAYHVRVPEGLVAYRMPAPAPAHGFALDLTAEDRISVDGSYNAALYPNARDALVTTLEWISGKARSVEKPQFRTATLGGLRGAEVTVGYRDKDTGAARMCRSVAAIRRMNPTDTMGIVYEIILDTSADRIGHSAHIFEAIVGSFRLDPLKP